MLDLLLPTTPTRRALPPHPALYARDEKGVSASLSDGGCILSRRHHLPIVYTAARLSWE